MNAVHETGAGRMERLASSYRSMLRIRVFEERSETLYKAGKIRGGLHLANGQEAVSVGVCNALRLTDTLTCTYRGHNAIIAKGAPLDRLFGELLGRDSGCCRGKGGSMHLTDFGVGVLGSFAVVGAHLPISAGAALSARYRGTDDVSVCFFGDGSTNIGVFHETLNMSAVWRLPVVYVCENNLWGEYSPIATTTTTTQLVERGASYGIWSVQVDGNDVEAVEAVAVEGVGRARRGEGPAFIEAMTYRQKGHSARADAGRPPEEVAGWLERDPLIRAEAALRSLGTTESAIAGIRVAVEEEIDDALARADSWPEPALDQLMTDVYS